MPRPREFDLDMALDQAMQVFWAKGYEATSLGDLTDAMGVSRSSFYQAFGSKHDLYLSALDRYGDLSVSRLETQLDCGATVRNAIASVFDALIDRAMAPDGNCGCLLGNTAVERARHDPEAQVRVTAALDRIERAYREAVQRGQARGEIAADRDAGALARYFVSSANGLQVIAKARPDRQVLEDIKQTVLSILH
ncbi:MAG: TetR/AcrR family transcriptional regulator [Rhodobacterales bacterium]|nr:TetR/AcrR family transcriptional regulator [Rhodobacterales bacterium]